ncbi:MAG: AbrB/MazE/SpoVT family DNA-binding domain-containing protein [archaeon]|nr:AbrB/MazE/SpoVT family DNA-binding domain-containing protein [archaeon]MCP8315147.1 AbrB/MazE/SpoVT family DNA-binding domain-containing protein [archaeon]
MDVVKLQLSGSGPRTQYRVTIPKELIQELGWQRGIALSVEKKNGYIVIRAMKAEG